MLLHWAKLNIASVSGFLVAVRDQLQLTNNRKTVAAGDVGIDGHVFNTRRHHNRGALAFEGRFQIGRLNGLRCTDEHRRWKFDLERLHLGHAIGDQDTAHNNHTYKYCLHLFTFSVTDIVGPS